MKMDEMFVPIQSIPNHNTREAEHSFFNKKLRSGLSTESFLAFCDFEYSKFLTSFLTFSLK